MEEEKLKEKILNSFNKDMDSNLRHLLIRIYNYCDEFYETKKTPKNLIYMQEAYDNISNTLYKEFMVGINNNDKIYKSNSLDKEDYIYNLYKMQNYAEFSNKYKKKFKVYGEYVNLKNDINKNYEYNDRLLTEALETYIMLTDCLENYDNNNAELKEKIIFLLTKSELLLNLPVTYLSKLNAVVDDFLRNNETIDRGEKIVK